MKMPHIAPVFSLVGFLPYYTSCRFGRTDPLQMNASSVEREAEAAALRHAASLFQRPDQLEKLDSQKKRADRKKAAVEAMLRTAVQSQLEGIRTAMNHLQSARSDVGLIEKE